VGVLIESSNCVPEIGRMSFHRSGWRVDNPTWSHHTLGGRPIILRKDDIRIQRVTSRVELKKKGGGTEREVLLRAR